MTKTTRVIRAVREGQYLAEVAVELIEDDHPWGPFLAPSETAKLDTVRLALRRGDIAEARRLATVYELKLVAAE